MGASYPWIKLVHIFVAVVALGTSAGLGILMEFYGNDRAHGSFMVRAIARTIAFVVLPGYLAMLATGLWMANMAWPVTATWLRLALGLWVLGLACLGGSLAALRSQLRWHTAEGYACGRFQRACMAARIFGGAFGLVVVGILYLMVFKP
jgi:uncharacterized membrane protein